MISEYSDMFLRAFCFSCIKPGLFWGLFFFLMLLNKLQCLDFFFCLSFLFNCCLPHWGKMPQTESFLFFINVFYFEHANIFLPKMSSLSSFLSDQRLCKLTLADICSCRVILSFPTTILT